MDRSRRVEIFSALSSDTRIRLIEILDEKQLSCEDPDECEPEELGYNGNQLVDQLEVTPASVSHHLKQLRRVGLVESEKKGRRVYCYLNRSAMEKLRDYFDGLSRRDGGCS